MGNALSTENLRKEVSTWDGHAEITRRYSPAPSPGPGVHQPMDLPLSHYYISSGHNSYLIGNQLSSDSGVEVIRHSLRMACRVIELDAYNQQLGFDGPVCKHGGTLTAPISFKACVEEIKVHAFASSPYPVIITIENHTDVPNQRAMAQVLIEVLGDMLYVPYPWEVGRTWKSPEDLKRKVVIRTNVGDDWAEEMKRLVLIPNYKFKSLEEANSAESVSSNSFVESAIPDIIKRAYTASGISLKTRRKSSIMTGISDAASLTKSYMRGSMDRIRRASQSESGAAGAAARRASQSEPGAGGAAGGAAARRASQSEPGGGAGGVPGVPGGALSDPSVCEALRLVYEQALASGCPTTGRQAVEGGVEADPVTLGTSGNGSAARQPSGDSAPSARILPSNQPSQDLPATLSTTQGSQQGHALLASRQDTMSGGVPSTRRAPQGQDLPGPLAPRHDSQGQELPTSLMRTNEQSQDLRAIRGANDSLDHLKRDEAASFVRGPGFRARRWLAKDPVYENEQDDIANAAESVHSLGEVYAYTTRNLMRVYPSGLRINSSNYNPVRAWSLGASIVALNWQNWDKPMWINKCFFTQNGGCGYVLKPHWMRNSFVADPTKGGGAIVPGSVPINPLPPRTPYKLQVDVLSAFCHHYAKGCIFLRSNLYVQINLYGMPHDWATHRTPTADNSARLYVDKTYEFSVQFPEVAVLLVTLMDQDSTAANDKLLGHWEVPVATLATGQFLVQLTDSKGRLRADRWVKLGLSWAQDHAPSLKDILEEEALSKARTLDTSYRAVEEARAALDTSSGSLDKAGEMARAALDTPLDMTVQDPRSLDAFSGPLGKAGAEGILPGGQGTDEVGLAGATAAAVVSVQGVQGATKVSAS